VGKLKDIGGVSDINYDEYLTGRFLGYSSFTKKASP